MNATATAPDLAELNGVKFALDRMGGGKPMLVLHGAGGSLAKAPFMAKLAERHAIWAPTHPGFHGSPLPDHFDHIDDLAYLYLDLLDAHGLQDVTVMGFSFGGWIAAEMAIKTTARIGRVILVDAVGIKVSDRTTRDIVDIFALHPMEANKLVWHDQSRVPDLSKLSDAEFTAMAKNREGITVYGWEPYLHDPKLARRLHRIKVPTMVIWGENDRLVSADYGRKYASLIPGAKFVGIPQCGHLPQMEQTEAFMKHVTSFTG